MSVFLKTWLYGETIKEAVNMQSCMYPLHATITRNSEFGHTNWLLTLPRKEQVVMDENKVKWEKNMSTSIWQNGQIKINMRKGVQRDLLYNTRWIHKLMIIAAVFLLFYVIRARKRGPFSSIHFAAIGEALHRKRLLKQRKCLIDVCRSPNRLGGPTTKTLSELRTETLNAVQHRFNFVRNEAKYVCEILFRR